VPRGAAVASVGTWARLRRVGGWSFRRRLSLLIAALLVPLISLTAYGYQSTADERRTAELQGASIVAQAIAGSEGFARDLEGTTLATALALDGWGAALTQESIGNYLQAIRSQNGVLRAIFVTDLEGRVIASDTGTGNGASLSDRPYIKAMQGGARMVWSDGLTGSETGQVTVVLGRVLHDENGAPRAFLVAALYPARLIGRMPLTLPVDASVTFIDNQGTTLFTTEQGGVLPERRTVGDAPGVSRAVAGEIVPFADSETPFAGVKRYGALVPVPRVEWAIAYARPQATLEAALRRRLLQDSAALIVTVLLAVGSVGYFVSRLVRPLTALAAAAAAVARGERASADVLPEANGMREVAQLSIAMRVMDLAVAQREIALRDETQTLETLLRTGTLLAGELDLERVVNGVTDAATELSGAEFGAFFYNVVGPRGEAYMLYSISGAPRETFSKFPMPRNTQLFGTTFRGDGVVRLADVRLDHRFGKNEPHFGMPEGHLPVVSYLAVPVRSSSGDVLGGLFFGHSRAGIFTERAERLVVGLAAQAGVAMDNARLYREANDTIRVRDEFLSSAAHDLKTPLAGIKGMTQLARRRLERGTDPATLDKGLASVEANVTRMAALLEDLLDVTRLHLGRPLDLDRASLDLVALAGHVAASHQASTERHVISLLVTEPSVIGNWDRRRLERVLDNLVDNAVKYSPEGGAITLRVELRPPTGGVLAAHEDLRVVRPADGSDRRNSTMSPNNINAAIAAPNRAHDSRWAVIAIHDQGVGIPADEIDSIFDRFRRGSNVVSQIQGTGIGLASARHIVESHGGVIRAESEEGQGSVFTIWLPPPEVGPPDQSTPSVTPADASVGGNASTAEPGQTTQDSPVPVAPGAAGNGAIP
jgi:signal transduction histidine kinase